MSEVENGAADWPVDLSEAKIKWLKDFFAAGASATAPPARQASASGTSGPVDDGSMPPGPLQDDPSPSGPVDDGSAPIGPVDDGTMPTDPDPPSAPAQVPAGPQSVPDPIPDDDGSSPMSPQHQVWQEGYDAGLNMGFGDPDPQPPFNYIADSAATRAYLSGAEAGKAAGAKAAAQSPPPAKPKAPPPPTPPAPKKDPRLVAHPQLGRLDDWIRGAARFIATPYGELMTLGSPTVAKLISLCLDRIKVTTRHNKELAEQISRQAKPLKAVEAFLNSPSKATNEVAARASDMAVTDAKVTRTSKAVLDTLGILVRGLQDSADAARRDLRAAEQHLDTLQKTQEIAQMEDEIESQAKKTDRYYEMGGGAVDIIAGAAEEDPAAIIKGAYDIVNNLFGLYRDDDVEAQLKTLRDRASDLVNKDAAVPIENARASIASFGKRLNEALNKLEQLQKEYEDNRAWAEDEFDKRAGGDFKFSKLRDAVTAVQSTEEAGEGAGGSADLLLTDILAMEREFPRDYIFDPPNTAIPGHVTNVGTDVVIQTDVDYGPVVQDANAPVVAKMRAAAQQWSSAGDKAGKDAKATLAKLNALRNAANDALADTSRRHKH